MYIFLIIWFLFLFAYIIFNVYGLYRVMAMRIKGDVIPLAVLIYSVAIIVIIIVSLGFFMTFEWSKSLTDLF
ncbi:MAG: hypothetical protein AAB785_00755 [Patescibacteria group bacterium]